MSDGGRTGLAPGAVAVTAVPVRKLTLPREHAVAAVRAGGRFVENSPILLALIVRSVLVPALTMVLGERTWWIPDWLGRILPHLNVEGQGAAQEKKAASASAVPAG